MYYNSRKIAALPREQQLELLEKLNVITEYMEKLPFRSELDFNTKLKAIAQLCPLAMSRELHLDTRIDKAYFVATTTKP